MSTPRFDRPCTTLRPDAACAALGRSASELLATFAHLAPLPPLDDPTDRIVGEPTHDREPLTPIVDRNIRVLSNYWHAGWAHARPQMQLRSEAAARLSRAAATLPKGFGLAVFDAHRPLPLQAELYAAAYADPLLPPGFVAEPVADLDAPPPHSTGGTVDCTLTLEGIALALGTDFDDFTDAALPHAFEAVPGLDRDLRRLLYRTMRSAGFVLLHCEWWHFEFGTRRWASITGSPTRYGRVREDGASQTAVSAS
jgi:zinc D-Ala-D-Ala dipeptidase